MSIITDENTFFNFTSELPWKSQYSGSTGTQDISSGLLSVTGTYVQTAAVVDFNSRAQLTHGFNTYYKMQGFNTATNKYEVWFSANAPLLTPPSGNALSNIEIVSSWVDR